ncbi:HAD family hydrolase [Jannaschia formosa]|uniref:HAD family hydrolase n=1 Tax=Jannaschia formosa TaxID=2259592 RepID=UPI000E1BB8BE|nr:HAD family hydrolase [Jannaschia formosa]TFL19113.1 HAD family hydrolase [Jannaschia formosa]
MKAILLGSLEVLSDTSDLWRKAFRQAFLDHSLSFGPRGGRSRLSGRMPDPAQEGRVPIDAVLRSRNAHYQAALARGPIRMRAGLVDTLDSIAAQGLALGLVATTPFEWAVSFFEGIGLAPERFDAIVTEDHVLADKPAPDCYHLAAAILAVAPENCLVVENSAAGVAAARAAGMQVMDLRGGMEPLSGLRAALPRPLVAALPG